MKKLNKSTILFIIISLFYAITNYIYWILNTPILPYNIDALHFMDVFRQNILYYNAPLIPTIIKSSLYWLGPKYFDLIIIIINYFFFLLGLYCIYQIGKLLSSTKAGQISMILFSLTPAVYSLSRFYGRQDYHVMIMMIISIYCLIQTNFFTNKKWVILYSISAALGLLCKDSFIVYFIIPYIYIIFKSLKNNSSKTICINIILSFILIILLSGIHYLRPLIIFKILFEPISETENLNILQNIYKLTFGLSQELLTLPLFILFVISFIWYLLKYNNKYKPLLFIWLLVPWITLLLMRHYKDSIFCMGLIPSIILISSIYITNIKRKFIKQILIYFFIVVGLLQFVEYSFNTNIGLKNLTLNLNGKKLYYFNKEANIANKNKKHINFLNNLLKIIIKYNSNKMYIRYNNKNIKLQFIDFLNYMNLNNIFFSYDSLMSWTDCSTIDTIIYIGDYLPVKSQLEEYIKELVSHPVSQMDNIDIQHYSNEFSEFAYQRENYIKDNFIVENEFNLSDDSTNNIKVTILIKK